MKTYITKVTSREKRIGGFVIKRLTAIVLFIVPLALLTIVLFYTVLRQPRLTDFSGYSFQICALVDRNPTSVSLTEYNQHPNRYTLCNKPVSGQTDNGFINLIWAEWEIKNFAWMLTEITGAPGDPHRYVYTIDDTGKVHPIWHQHADDFGWCLSVLFSGFIIYLFNKGYLLFNKGCRIFTRRRRNRKRND